MTCKAIWLVALAACTETEVPTTTTPPSAPEAASTAGTQGPIAPTVMSCAYTEQHDGTNDYRANGYQLESSGIVFDGVTPATICGQIDNGHFDTTDYAIDIDNYGVALAQDTDVIVTLTGNAQAIATLGIWAYDPSSGNTVGGGYFVGDHGVFTAHMPAGSYEISVEAYDNGDAAVVVPYRLTIGGDAPATRCGTMTGLADYVEAHDGVDNTQNDMIDVDFNSWPDRAYAAATDSPEAMTLAVDSGVNYRIDGVAAGTAAQVGSYFDHDTYAITTGPATTQLTIRLDWAGANTDLDFYISAAGATFAFAASATPAMGGGEFATFAVVPNTTYWFWVGAYQSSTAGTSYNATICAETFSALQ